MVVMSIRFSVLGCLSAGASRQMILLRFRLIENARVKTAVEVNIGARKKLIGKDPAALAKHIGTNSAASMGSRMLEARPYPRRQAETTDDEQHER